MRVLEWLLPQDCLLCGQAAGARALCAACAADLPLLPAQRCPVCALPTPAGAVCGACLKHPPHYDETIAPLVYAFPVDRLLQALKYGHRLAIAAHFARLLEAAAAGVRADIVLPMPLHRGRLRERGFNQAVELARPLARARGLPLAFDLVERSRDTVPQASLPWKNRARNIRGAFLCRARLDGRQVLIVDDIMTTGATLNELARALRNAGAARVTNCVVARTLPP
jgi:ComF family protein